MGRCPSSRGVPGCEPVDRRRILDITAANVRIDAEETLKTLPS
jgi:hypothetical protein